MNNMNLGANNWTAELDVLAKEFQMSKPLLKAIGDEMRQRLILILIRHADGHDTGMRVGEIAAEINLSRPAVSHHLKILRESGLVDIRQEGTKNFYHLNRYLPPVENLIQLLQHTQRLMQSVPSDFGG